MTQQHQGAQGHQGSTGTEDLYLQPYGGVPYDLPQQRGEQPPLPGGAEGAGTRTGTEPAEPAGSTEPSAPPRPAKPGRDRYLDLLRTIALVRVVVYHVFGWAWLSILFPSMGVMFALAGSLMARSLSRPALGVIRGRVRRLLPPLWVFGAVVVTLLLLGGWNPADGGTWSLASALNYVFPLGAPPYPEEIGFPGGLLDASWAAQAAEVLWYLRTYLWFVLASPLLLWAFRRAPWVTLAAPMALTAVVGTGLVPIPGETGNAVTDFAVYGSCWVLGFAHQEGLLARVPRYLAVSVSALIMAFGLWWASGHLTEDGWDLNSIPLAQATWSFGFVVILLSYSPSWQELPGRLAKWDWLVTLFNNRAVTIYLWHNLLIAVTSPIIDQFYSLPFMDERMMDALTTTYSMWMFVLVWPLIGLSIVAVGWIEDIAAKRSPRLWPIGVERGQGRRKG
ncbi:acyltransferase family protein [Streptomyces sp. CRN 30]|uniref:acyltransferase family protein n=1 Tax=Streptomyces sp. CRN 30 TaxID=3075613 RepID=UPI002A8049F2|nr:acyltransferase family protein [Streptomyces sp. CRN 30]